MDAGMIQRPAVTRQGKEHQGNFVVLLSDELGCVANNTDIETMTYEISTRLHTSQVPFNGIFRVSNFS